MRGSFLFYQSAGRDKKREVRLAGMKSSLRDFELKLLINVR